MTPFFCFVFFSIAQKTVFAHSNKIKELRAEIQNEKMRHQSVDNTLQGKITSLVTHLQDRIIVYDKACNSMVVLHL